MKYQKIAISWDDQADLLIARGMNGDKLSIANALQTANYYRLSGYWYPFRKPDATNPKIKTDNFKENTSFAEIWDRYVFDRELRLLVLDAIERIEVATRSLLMYYHSHAHGPFGYATNSMSLPNAKESERQIFLQNISRESARSNELFATHFQEKYGNDHLKLPKDKASLPAWMLCEVISFGTLCWFYKYADEDVQQKVADTFSIPVVLFESWLQALRIIRNTCAHHSRLWNKKIHHRERPQVPKNAKKFPDWHTPFAIENDHVFGILTICKFLLDQIYDTNKFADDLHQLVSNHPNIPLVSMGFPTNWKDSNLWKLPDPDNADDS